MYFSAKQPTQRAGLRSYAVRGHCIVRRLCCALLANANEARRTRRYTSIVNFAAPRDFLAPSVSVFPSGEAHTLSPRSLCSGTRPPGNGCKDGDVWRRFLTSPRVRFKSYQRKQRANGASQTFRLSKGPIELLFSFADVAFPLACGSRTWSCTRREPSIFTSSGLFIRVGA